MLIGRYSQDIFYSRTHDDTASRKREERLQYILLKRDLGNIERKLIKQEASWYSVETLR